MGTITLRSCPFCGDGAEPMVIDTCSGDMVLIKCGLCGAASKAFPIKENSKYAATEAVRKAANFWNRRVDQ